MDKTTKDKYVDRDKEKIEADYIKAVWLGGFRKERRSPTIESLTFTSFASATRNKTAKKCYCLG